MQSMKPIVLFFSESADELALRGSAKCIFVALRLPPSMRNLLDASCAAGSRPSKEPAPINLRLNALSGAVLYI